MRTTLTTAAAALLLTSAASAQEVAFKPTLEAGATMSYELTATLDVTQKIGETSTNQKTEHTAAFTCTVESVNRDGSAEVSMMFDSLSFSIASGENTDVFTWADNGGERPNAAMGEGLNASGLALAGATIGFTVGTDGQVSGMTGLDGFLATINPESASDVSFIGVFTPDRLAEAIEPIFDADGGGAEPRSPGAKWTETETVSLGAAGEIVITRDYTFPILDNGMANVLTRPSIKLNKPDVTPENAPNVRLNGVDGAVIIQWNTERNMLEQYGRTEQIGTVWEMGDATLTQTQNSVMRLLRKGN